MYNGSGYRGLVFSQEFVMPRPNQSIQRTNSLALTREQVIQLDKFTRFTQPLHTCTALLGLGLFILTAIHGESGAEVVAKLAAATLLFAAALVGKGIGVLVQRGLRPAELNEEDRVWLAALKSRTPYVVEMLNDVKKQGRGLLWLEYWVLEYRHREKGERLSIWRR